MDDDRNINNKNIKAPTLYHSKSRELAETTLRDIGIHVPVKNNICFIGGVYTHAFPRSVAISISRNGHFVAVVYDDKTAILWEAATGRIIRKFKGHKTFIKSLAISQDSRFLLTGGSDKTAILWDLTSGRIIRLFEGHSGFIESVAFSFDSKFIITGSWDKTAILWETETGRKLQIFEGNTYHIDSVCISNNGKIVLTGSHEAILWEAATGRKIKTFHGGPLSALSNDNRFVLTGKRRDGNITLWGAITGKKIRAFKFNGSLYSLSFSPDGRFVLAAVGGKASGSGLKAKFWGEAILWETETGEKLRVFNCGPVSDAVISYDGSLVFTASKSVAIWETATGRKINDLKEHRDRVSFIRFSADGRFFFVGGGKNNVFQRFDATTYEKITTYEGHTSSVTDLVVNSDAKIIATRDYGGTTILWETETGKKLQIFNADEFSINSLAFSTDEGLLWIANSDRKISHFRYDTKEIINEFEFKDPNISGFFSPNGSYFLSVRYGDYLSGGLDDICKNSAVLYNLKTGEKLRSFDGHTLSVKTVAFSTDEKLVLTTGGADRIAILWEVATGNKIRTFKGHNGKINVLVFSPGDKFVLTAGEDKIAILWDRDTGEDLLILKGHKKKITSAAFSPDGRFILTGSDDYTVIFWDANTGELLVKLHNLKNGFLWTTPPDDVAKSGWFWTDRPELITVLSCNEDGTESVTLDDGSEGRDKFIKLYNNQRMVMDRLNNWDEHKRRLNIYLGGFEHLQLENHIRLKQKHCLPSIENISKT